MKCKDCTHLRQDIKAFGGRAELPKEYGKFTNPCNRFPMNIMRSPEEPACGEFSGIYEETETEVTGE